MDFTPPPEESFLTGKQFKNIPGTPRQGIIIPDTDPQSPPPLPQRPLPVSRHPRRRLAIVFLLGMSLIIIVGAIIIVPALKTRFMASAPTSASRTSAIPTYPPIPTPVFDPSEGAVLPTHRVVAFYAVPYAEPTGPAYEPTAAMLAALKKQGTAYQQLDPAHPVQLGIDLVVSVPDAFPGPQGTYSHHVDPGTIQTYIDFCRKNDLLLFLDLNFGQAPIMREVKFFLPYLEQYTFVHMAVDPEWMFPRHNGIPGINLSNVRASDLNPIIEAIATIPMQYHVPRKILIIHQYRPDGDGLKDPYDPGLAEIADKHNLLLDPRVDVVIHIDSVGGYSGDIHDKMLQYTAWVQQDQDKYSNFLYGGFKLFYQHESKIRLMTPKEVLALDPPPMVVTYGN